MLGFAKKLALGAVLLASLPSLANAQMRATGLKYIPTSLQLGVMTPYPIDIVHGTRDASLFFYYYEWPFCNELCKSQIDERIQTLNDLRSEIQRGQIAFVFRPLTENDEQARAAMTFACLPEQEALPRFLRFLKDNDGKTLPVPERYVDVAASLGVAPQDYMACVNDASKWSFYKGQTDYMERNIGWNTKRRVWIHGMVNNFRSDYLRTFMDFLYNTPDYKRASLLKKNLASDIIIGSPDKDKVRLTIYMAPDGAPERQFLAKYLQKFIQVYVNSNQAYIVFRTYNWYRPSSEKAAEFLYCVPQNYKFHMMEQMYASMNRWKVSEETDPTDMLLALAKFNGLSAKKIERCMKSTRTTATVRKERLAAEQQLKLVVSPVIFMNDELFSIGSPSFAEMMQHMRKLEALKEIGGLPKD